MYLKRWFVKTLLIVVGGFFLCELLVAQQPSAPLYRDPIYDGAADPIVIWNHVEKEWWMIYSQRKANQQIPDVAFCYGTDIGIASSSDNGASWIYRGTFDLEFEKGRNTFWAPDIIYNPNDKLYHMFVVYIKGVRIHWGGDATIHHYTSKDMWKWKHIGPLKLSSPRVIDAALIKMDNGKYRMWYKDDEKGGITMMSESKDLYKWENAEEPIIGGQAHEGPIIFKFKDYYWLLTDEWQGMRIYRSNDLDNWEKQGLVLDTPSSRHEDSPSGAHGDVVVVDGKAYIFYFTHPGRKSHFEGEMDSDGVYSYTNRRSVVQVGELVFKNGTLECDRDKPFDFFLPNLN